MKKIFISSFLLFICFFIYHPQAKAANPNATCPGTCVTAASDCTGESKPQPAGDAWCNYEFHQTRNICCSGITVNVDRPGNIKITDVGKLIGALISAVFVIAGLIAFVFLIWGGIQWITSGGDKAGVEGAQKRIQAALIGLLIVAASWAIMSLVAKFLGIDIFNLNFATPF
jgi:hypothetical protein